MPLISELLCQAEESGCFTTANPSETDFLECLTEILAPMNEPPVELPCEIAVEGFNNNYGTNFSALDLAVLTNGFGGLCGDQAAFDEMVKREVLSSIYSTNITSTSFIDGTLYGIDDDGVLHIYIPPIDMNSSSNIAILEQIILVMNKMYLYFCEGNSYEPIDWRDYFDNLRNISAFVTWNGCMNVGFDISFHMSPHYFMDTGAAAHNYSGSNRYYYKWNHRGSEAPMLQITLPDNCLPSFEDMIYPDCD